LREAAGPFAILAAFLRVLRGQKLSSPRVQPLKAAKQHVGTEGLPDLLARIPTALSRRVSVIASAAGSRD